MNNCLKVTLCFLLAFNGLAYSDEKGDVKKGVKFFQEGKLEEALTAFKSAEKAAPESLLPKYNALTTMAYIRQLNDMETKLTEEFESLGKDPVVRAKSAYNLGSAYLALIEAADKQDKLMERAQEVGKSVQWLKQSLLDNYLDNDAKNNLEYARKFEEKLKQQQQQQQDQQSDQENNEKKDQDSDKQQNQDNQQQQQQKDQQQNKKDQKQQQQKQQQQNQQQKQQQQQREISDSTAENLLQAAKTAEKQAMKLLRENQARKNKKQAKRGKDW